MIGALKYQIELLTPSRVDDAGGGGTVSWSQTASVYASVDRLPATTDVAGDREVKLARVAATIRQRSGLSLGARFRFLGTEFEITSIEDDDDKRRYVTLVGEEVQA